MSDNPIYDAVAAGYRDLSQPPRLVFTPKYWERRQKKARSITSKVWKEVSKNGTNDNGGRS